MITIIKRLFKATRYALNGLYTSYQRELALKIECCLSLLLFPLALVFGKTPIEKILLIGVWVCVLVVELLNSAIELVVNRIGLEHHVLSGLAKDTAAAAVFISLLFAVFTWFFLLL